MADVLTAFLHAAASEPFGFGGIGVTDCCMFPANWVRLKRGIDPLARYRGTYADEAGWRALAKQAGGLQALIGHAFDGVGLDRVSAGESSPGDVALVHVPRFDFTAGAIRTEFGWVLKLTRGLCRLRCEPLSVWRI